MEVFIPLHESFKIITLLHKNFIITAGKFSREFTVNQGVRKPCGLYKTLLNTSTEKYILRNWKSKVTMECL
jgi:hypothetical protein